MQYFFFFFVINCSSFFLFVCTRWFFFQYLLTLVASDSLNENSTMISIQLRDLNDLPPVFPRTDYTISMNEERKVFYRLVQVNMCSVYILFF